MYGHSNLKSEHMDAEAQLVAPMVNRGWTEQSAVFRSVDASACMRRCVAVKQCTGFEFVQHNPDRGMYDDSYCRLWFNGACAGPGSKAWSPSHRTIRTSYDI